MLVSDAEDTVFRRISRCNSLLLNSVFSKRGSVAPETVQRVRAADSSRGRPTAAHAWLLLVRLVRPTVESPGCWRWSSETCTQPCTFFSRRVLKLVPSHLHPLRSGEADVARRGWSQVNTHHDPRSIQFGHHVVRRAPVRVKTGAPRCSWTPFVVTLIINVYIDQFLLAPGTKMTPKA